MTKGSTGRSNQKKPIDEERETNMKAAASINVSDFSVPLKEPQVNPELSSRTWSPTISGSFSDSSPHPSH